MSGGMLQGGYAVMAAFAAVVAAALLAPEPRTGSSVPVLPPEPSAVPVAAAPAAPPPAAEKGGEPAGEPLVVPSRVEALAEENDALHAANDGLLQENESLRQQLTGVLNWILANFRGRYAIPERLVDRLDVAAVADDFTLHEDLAEMLQITPEERERINEAFQAARAMVETAENEVMMASAPSPDVGVIEIPPFETRGAEVRDHLLAALDSALGSNRAPWAASAAGRDLERRFGGFGRSSRTIRFELVYDSAGGAPVIRIRDQRETPDGEGRRRIEATEIETDGVPAEYMPYVSRLPADAGGG